VGVVAAHTVTGEQDIDMTPSSPAQQAALSAAVAENRAVIEQMNVFVFRPLRRCRRSRWTVEVPLPGCKRQATRNGRSTAERYPWHALRREPAAPVRIRPVASHRKGAGVRLNRWQMGSATACWSAAAGATA